MCLPELDGMKIRVGLGLELFDDGREGGYLFFQLFNPGFELLLFCGDACPFFGHMHTSFV